MLQAYTGAVSASRSNHFCLLWVLMLQLRIPIADHWTYPLPLPSSKASCGPAGFCPTLAAAFWFDMAG